MSLLFTNCNRYGRPPADSATDDASVMATDMLSIITVGALDDETASAPAIDIMMSPSTVAGSFATADAEDGDNVIIIDPITTPPSAETDEQSENCGDTDNEPSDGVDPSDTDVDIDGCGATVSLPPVIATAGSVFVADEEAIMFVTVISPRMTEGLILEIAAVAAAGVTASPPPVIATAGSIFAATAAATLGETATLPRTAPGSTETHPEDEVDTCTDRLLATTDGGTADAGDEDCVNGTATDPSDTPPISVPMAEDDGEGDANDEPSDTPPISEVEAPEAGDDETTTPDCCCGMKNAP